MDAFLFLSPSDWVATGLFFLLGLLIGSFLNVVIYRLPVMMQRESDNYVASETGKELPFPTTYNLITPRSACPHCGHKISATENIPVISYLLQRGKCSSCKSPISARYPIIEIICGLLTGALIWHFGSGWQGLTAIVFGWFLLAATVIDLDTQLLPDDLTLPLLWLGLLINLPATFTPMNEAVIGATVGYLCLWSVYWAFKLLTGKEGMGYGDFKLLAALGAWLGWKFIPIIILLSSIVGVLIGGSYLLIKQRRGSAIPFGPYLALAGMISLIWGKQLNEWILPGL